MLQCLLPVLYLLNMHGWSWCSAKTVQTCDARASQAQYPAIFFLGLLTTILPSCRYKNFLGLNNPNDFMAAAAEMKAKGDFTSLGSDAAAIAAIRSQGMAADKVLGLNDVAAADATAR
jgi:hypothetical protein